MIKNRNVNRVFNDLDDYRNFCVTYGYVFDEKDLYKRNNLAYVQYERYRRGDAFIDRWAEDAAHFARRAG
jgi:hypothetical protein